MKIAYFLELNPVTHLGVYNKVIQQVDEWRKEHDVKVYMISHTDSESVVVKSYVNMFCSFFVKYFDNPIARYFNRILSFRRCIKEVRAYEPEIIYYRQNVYFPGLGGLFKIARTVVEVNHPVKSYEGTYPAAIEKIFSTLNDSLLEKASGFICVSRHIKDSLDDAGFVAEKLVLANGARFLDSVPQRDEEYVRPRLIMIGSPSQSWQGYDKYIKMAILLPEFDFFLVGPEKEQLEHRIPSNLYVLGFKTQDELYLIYKNIDIGVGTLAAHRKSINEASPLKTREYAKFGLPMIIGYEDTDISNNNTKVCNVGNYERNVEDNILRIKKFVLGFFNIEKKVDGYELICSIRKECVRMNFFKRF